MFLFSSTYTTLANSKSPNIKCLGRVSTTTLDIRRVRVVFGAVDPAASLVANEIEGRRPPKQYFKYS